MVSFVTQATSKFKSAIILVVVVVLTRFFPYMHLSSTGTIYSWIEPWCYTYGILSLEMNIGEFGSLIRVDLSWMDITKIPFTIVSATYLKSFIPESTFSPVTVDQ